jgi:hypothetical protein
MPGCSLATSLDDAFLVVGSGGVGRFSYPIANVPQLVGLPFYLQALVFDIAANPFGAVVSEAWAGVVGM